MRQQKSNQKVLVVLVGVVMAVGGYMLAFKPQSASLAQIQESHQLVDEELAFARASQAEQGDEAEGPDQAAIDAAVPPTSELAALLRQIDTIAAASGMAASSVSPSPPVVASPGAASSVLIAISASGTRARAYDFLRQLRDLDRLVLVDQVSLQAPAADSAGGTFQLDLTARAFTTQAGTAAPVG